MVSATETIPAHDVPAKGLMTATFVVVSNVIGTGVLTTSGFTVSAVGSNQLMLVLWVVGGLLAICGALTLCELSASLPRTKGDYVFLSEAYGPLVALDWNPSAIRGCFETIFLSTYDVETGPWILGHQAVQLTHLVRRERDLTSLDRLLSGNCGGTTSVEDECGGVG